MREKIRAFRRWFNEQSLRERGLLTLVVLVAAFMAWDLALMGPMRNQDTTLHDTVASLRAQVEALESEARLTLLQAEHQLVPEQAYSFPFPRFVGRVFLHNEFVVVGRKPGS